MTSSKDSATPLAMREAAKYCIPSHVICETLDSEMVLLNLDTGIYFGLNASGVCVWKHLSETQTYQSAVTELCQAADASEEQVRRDVERLVARLLEHGLLQLASPIPPAS